MRRPYHITEFYGEQPEDFVLVNGNRLELYNQLNSWENYFSKTFQWVENGEIGQKDRMFNENHHEHIFIIYTTATNVKFEIELFGSNDTVKIDRNETDEITFPLFTTDAFVLVNPLTKTGKMPFLGGKIGRP